MKHWLALGILAVVVSAAAPAWAGDLVRISGHMHSITPSDGVLVIACFGADGVEEMVWVHVRDAKVVRLWRDKERPWEWRERSTSIYRLPTNTYVTVIGREGLWGIIRANRIDVPEIDSDQ